LLLGITGKDPKFSAKINLFDFLPSFSLFEKIISQEPGLLFSEFSMGPPLFLGLEEEIKGGPLNLANPH